MKFSNLSGVLVLHLVLTECLVRKKEKPCELAMRDWNMLRGLCTRHAEMSRMGIM